MLAFLFSSLLIFAAPAGNAGSDSAWGGFVNFWNTYLNYPGFEAWRFFNLAVFIGVMVYLLKKPLSEAFKAKRETIRAELIKAEEEKRAALEQLTSAEAQLVRLDIEAEEIRANARLESNEEKRRIHEQTLQDIAKTRKQAEDEIERLTLQIKSELRRFSAEESIKRAEEKIKTSITAEKDARLVKSNIQTIGGLN